MGNHMTLAESFIQCCLEKNWKVSFAESCTGGALAAAVTAVPGASEVFLGSVVSYSNFAKTRSLGVSEALLGKHSAVSEPVAKAMLEGVLSLWHTDLVVATTGFAGPSGGTVDTPVGTVFIAMGGKQLPTEVVKVFFEGERQEIIQQTVEYCLEALMRRINCKG